MWAHAQSSNITLQCKQNLQKTKGTEIKVKGYERRMYRAPIIIILSFRQCIGWASVCAFEKALDKQRPAQKMSRRRS